MPPKRKAEQDEPVQPRPARAAKKVHAETDEKHATAGKAKSSKTKAKKERLPSKDEFKAAALPLHVNITHTPPPIDQVAAASKDPGSLGHIVLTPDIFSTRSYGWKGSKKILVELENSEGAEKKAVWVQLSINAIVAGSKGAGDDEDEDASGGAVVPVEGQEGKQ